MTSSTPTVAIRADFNLGCLDVPNSDASNGANLILANCDSTDSQSWLQNSDGSISSSLNNDKCIEVEGAVYNPGVPIEIQDCVGGRIDQKWTFANDGTIKSDANPLFCFDGNAIDSVVYIWACDGSSDQYWSLIGNLTPTPSPTLFSPLEIALEATRGGCIAVPNDDTSNGKDLKLEQCDSTDSQSWEQNMDGSISTSLDTNKCITVEGSASYDDEPIEIEDCSSGNPCQQFIFQPDGTIQSAGDTSYCVDENGIDSLIKMKPCDATSDDQLWIQERLPRQPQSIVIELDLGGCLSVPNSNPINGIDLVLSVCDRSSSQSWFNYPDGSISSSLSTTKCIEPQGGVYGDGVPLEIQDCVNGSRIAQQWTFVEDGTIRPISDSTFCWDSNGIDDVIYLWICDGSDDQNWSSNVSPSSLLSAVPSIPTPLSSEPSMSPSSSLPSSQHVLLISC